MHTSAGALGGQKRALAPLELELQSVLETEFRSSEKAACTLTAEPSL